MDFPNLPYFIDEDVQLSEPLAIMKYIALRYGSETLLGGNLEEKASVEMFTHTLTELNRMASMPCYFDNVDQQELSDNLLLNMASLASVMEARRSKYLVGSHVTLTDFMLFELCERI